MPAPAFQNVKVTMEFSMPGDGGWTESWYRPANVIDANTQLTALQLILKRTIPLVSCAKIKGYRISAVQARRVSQHFRLVGRNGQAAYTRDNVKTTIEVGCLSNGGHQRALQIHGIADDASNWDLAGNELTGVGPNLKAYLDYVGNPANGWQMRVETQVAGDPGLTPVWGIAVANGVAAFQVDGLTIVPKQRFIITGLKGYKVSQFRGTWQTMSYTPAAPPLHGILYARSRRLLDPNFMLEQPGEIRVITPTFYTFETLASIDQAGAKSSTRTTGREPGQPRGKRSLVH